MLHRQARGAIVFAMWFLSAVLLLLQSQPLLGSALCLRDTEPKAECAMQDIKAPAGSGVAQTAGAHTEACMGTVYCAWTAPAVPKFAQNLPLIPLIHNPVPLFSTSLLPGDPLGPPFHPPRA